VRIINIFVKRPPNKNESRLYVYPCKVFYASITMLNMIVIKINGKKYNTITPQNIKAIHTDHELFNETEILVMD
jgi:hypothetical protein